MENCPIQRIRGRLVPPTRTPIRFFPYPQRQYSTPNGHKRWSFLSIGYILNYLTTLLLLGGETRCLELPGLRGLHIVAHIDSFPTTTSIYHRPEKLLSYQYRLGLPHQNLQVFGALEPWLSRPQGRIGTILLKGQMMSIGTPQINGRIIVIFMLVYREASQQKNPKEPLDCQVYLCEPACRHIWKYCSHGYL